MAATKPTRGERAKKNAVKRAKPKTNPMDKKPKKTAMSGGNGKKRKNA